MQHDSWTMPVEIPGASALAARFGPNHTFHDAEVISIVLRRKGVSELRIHTWKMTNEVDDKGHYRRLENTVVVFEFEDVSECLLDGFNFQNVIGSLRVASEEGGFDLIMESTFGVGGHLRAAVMRIKIEPITPDD